MQQIFDFTLICKLPMFFKTPFLQVTHCYFLGYLASCLFYQTNHNLKSQEEKTNLKDDFYIGTLGMCYNCMTRDSVNNPGTLYPWIFAFHWYFQCKYFWILKTVCNTNELFTAEIILQIFAEFNKQS